MEINRDLDPLETQEWLDALRAVQQHLGPERANFLVDKLVQEARREGIYIPASLTTAYRNTLVPEKEERSPGDRDIEHKIRSAIRWNAVAIILRANKEHVVPGLGFALGRGHVLFACCVELIVEPRACGI